MPNMDGWKRSVEAEIQKVGQAVVDPRITDEAVEPLTPERILASLEAKRDSYAEGSSGRLMMNGVVGHVRDLINGCTCKPGTMLGHWGCPIHDVNDGDLE
jgi:hypothetical protein